MGTVLVVQPDPVIGAEWAGALTEEGHHVLGAEGIRSALDRAREAAQGKDIRVGGGVATVRQYLQAGLIDEMHLAISPVLLGTGENLFDGLDLPKPG